MVYISRVYTKQGDGGQTRLADGTWVSKDSARLAAYGTVDEANACVGLVRTELAREPRRATHGEVLEKLDRELTRIQHELFNLGAELATPTRPGDVPSLRVETRHIEALERDLDAWNEDLPALRSFVLPGGGPVGASLHLARTVCRRAERETVRLGLVETIRPESVQYLNRLSDYLFVAGRAAAHRLGEPEPLWDPSTT